MLLGSASVKAARKTLMKLTTGVSGKIWMAPFNNHLLLYFSGSQPLVVGKPLKNIKLDHPKVGHDLSVSKHYY